MAKYAASAKARTPATVCTWERYVVSDENAWVKVPNRATQVLLTGGPLTLSPSLLK
jgi:hypothetical protein